MCMFIACFESRKDSSHGRGQGDEDLPLFTGLMKVSNWESEISDTATDSMTFQFPEKKLFPGQELGQKLSKEMQNSLAQQHTADWADGNAPHPYGCKEHTTTSGFC